MLLALIILQDILMLLFFKRSKVNQKLSDDPRVSVLVAARNEEACIEACLEALATQNYSPSSLEILVGDDQSTDGTAEIIKRMEKTGAPVRYLAIPQEYHGLSGKAKVLAYLAKEAAGEYYLITDADTTPNPEWARTMVQALSEEGFDLVNGVTEIPDSIFQDMEWIHAQGLLKLLADFWRPVTCIGNNTGITRRAYEAVGGYESIPFSLTEDRALFVEAHKAGFRLKQLNQSSALASGLHVPLMVPYLQQRKRWLTGAIQLPIGVQILLGLQSLFLVLVVAVAFFSMKTAALALVTRIVIRMFLFHRLFSAIGRYRPFWHAIWFELASGIMNVLVLVNFLIPTKIKWKDRTY